LEFSPPGAGILKIAGEPFPDGELQSFARSHKQVVVLEEGDPILESRVIALAPSGVKVRGRLSGDLKSVGELQTGEIEALLNGSKPQGGKANDLPARIPEICKPCGYNKVFGAIKELNDIATPSDIGCNTMGGLPPYSVMDGVWAMGSSIGIACGLAVAGHPRILAIIGDSTFLHAGLPPLIEAVHQRYRLTVLLLDNGAAAMTGGQPVAHRSTGPSETAIDLEHLIAGLGVKQCTPFDPHKLGQHGIAELIEHSFDQPGVKVLLYRSQCGLFTPGYFTEAPYSVATGRKNGD
jgi:indolepyruvate ferredoxin oxidoreductase alpha subunit